MHRSHLGADRCRELARGLFRVTKDTASSGELLGLCPIHGEKNASFSYNWRKDTYHCLSCGASGDLVRLWCATEGLEDRGEGFQQFKDKFGALLKQPKGFRPSMSPDPGNLANPKGADRIIPEREWASLARLPENWLKRLEQSRGWSRQVMQALDLRFGVAQDGENRVAIPVRNESGQLVNVRLYLPGARDNKIRSWRKGYGQARLWPPPAQWQPGPVWLCEGEPDCLCARSLGLNAVTQTAGANTWKASFNDYLAGREVIIAYDADQQGRKGARRVADALAGLAKSVRIIRWPSFMTNHQDLTDFVVKHGKGKADLEALAREANEYHSQTGLPDEGKDSGDSHVGPERFWARNHDGRMSFRPARLAKEIMDELELVTCRATRITYRWSGQYFRPVTEDDLMGKALEKLADCATTARARDAISQVRFNSYLPEDHSMNPRPHLLCLTNGMFDLSARQASEAILPPAKHYLCNYQFPWSFDPRHPQDCPQWKAFLASQIGEPAVVDELQEFFGYCLWPDCRWDMVLFLVGPGATGKSTVLEVLRAMVGAENTTSVSVAALDENFERASLHNKRLNIFTEADSRIFSSQHLKAIAAGEPVRAAFKYCDPFDLVYTGKLAFACNRFPRVADYSDAFYRRLLVIEMNRQIPHQSRDARLKDHLLTELEGIFAWSLVGLHRLWRRGGFARSQTSEAVVAHYRRENNPVMGFVEDCLTTDPPPGEVVARGAQG